MIKAVYIHIPFCQNICSYCDFCKFFYNDKIVDTYLESLEKEIRKYYNSEIIETIYIGGGTPSALNTTQLRRLFETIQIFKTNHLEYTIECNVEDINETQLELFKKFGINRLSIGVQTFHEESIKYLDRHHTKDNAIEKINLAKEYFENINVDLIYAIPGETLETLRQDLEILLNLDIQHISAYSLIIEPHTILNNKGVTNIDEELDSEMYQLIINKLIDFDHYEISNFGKIKSRHNLVYWNNEEYYGFGIGASGYANGIRYDNVKSLKSYNSGKYRFTEEELTVSKQIENEFILGLRKTAGIHIENFFYKYQKDILDIKTVKELISERKLILKDNHLFINPEMLYISNEILIRLME